MTTQARELAKLVTNAGDLNLGDDISLASDGAILNFGADSDVTLTHVADTGLLLNSSRQLQFGDSGTFIRQEADGVLDLTSDTEIELNATTLDINANVDISGTLTVAGALDFGDLDISNVGSLALDTITNDGTDITLDSSGDIILDADGANILLKDGGTQFGEFENSSNDFRIKSVQQDKDIIFRGNDGGTYINALTLDMSNSGLAVFNAGISGDTTAKSYTWRAVGNSGSSGHRWVKIARIYGVQSSRVSIDLVGRAGYGDGDKPSYARVIGQLNNDNNYDFDVQKTGSPFEEIGQVDVDDNHTDIYVKITSFAELSAHGVISSGTITPTTGNSGSSQGEGSEPANYVAFTERNIIIEDSSGNLTVGSLLTVNDGAVFNEGSADKDFRVESNDHTHMLFVDGGTNRVGINNPSSVTAPAFPFVAWDDDEVTVLAHGNNATYIQRYQDHASAPATLVIDKARGTQASPTTVSPGDDIGRILMRGYTNNGYYEAASIHAEASAVNLVNNGADIPSDIYFKTTQDGGGGPLERLRIDYDGAVWQKHSHHGRYTWVKRVVFTAGQTQNLTFHLDGGNVHGQVRVTLSGDYSNVNANGSFEKVWGWGYNSSNTSGYGGQGTGTTIVNVGSTSNVMTFGSMSKTNATTVIIPINNTAASYQVICSVVVEITGELQGLKYTSIS